MAQRRTRVILAQLRASAADPALIEMTGQLQTCEEKLRVIISTQTCAQKLIRLGAMDAMTGMDTAAADGSILLAEGTDQDLDSAMHILRPLKSSFPLVSWADLIQMSRATAIEHCGGPRVPMRYGRLDADIVQRGENDKTRMNGYEKEAVHTQVRETVAKLDSQTEAIAMLAHTGMSPGHQLVLAGDIENKFEKSGKPNLIEVGQ